MAASARAQWQPTDGLPPPAAAAAEPTAFSAVGEPPATVTVKDGQRFVTLMQELGLPHHTGEAAVEAAAPEDAASGLPLVAVIFTLPGCRLCKTFLKAHHRDLKGLHAASGGAMVHGAPTLVLQVDMPPGGADRAAVTAARAKSPAYQTALMWWKRATHEVAAAAAAQEPCPHAADIAPWCARVRDDAVLMPLGVQPWVIPPGGAPVRLPAGMWGEPLIKDDGGTLALADLAQHQELDAIEWHLGSRSSLLFLQAVSQAWGALLVLPPGMLHRQSLQMHGLQDSLPEASDLGGTHAGDSGAEFDPEANPAGYKTGTRSDGVLADWAALDGEPMGDLLHRAPHVRFVFIMNGMLPVAPAAQPALLPQYKDVVSMQNSAVAALLRHPDVLQQTLVLDRALVDLPQLPAPCWITLPRDGAAYSCDEGVLCLRAMARAGCAD